MQQMKGVGNCPSFWVHIGFLGARQPFEQAVCVLAWWGALTLLALQQQLSLGISCLHQGLLMESICIPNHQDSAAYQHFWSLMEFLLAFEHVKTFFNVSERDDTFFWACFVPCRLYTFLPTCSFFCQETHWDGNTDFPSGLNLRQVERAGAKLVLIHCTLWHSASDGLQVCVCLWSISSPMVLCGGVSASCLVSHPSSSGREATDFSALI